MIRQSERRTVSGAGGEGEAHSGGAGAAGARPVGRLHLLRAHVQVHVPVLDAACRETVQMVTFQAKLPALHNSADVSARHHGTGAAGKATGFVRVWNARRAWDVRPVAVACLQPATLASGGHSQHAPEIAEVSFQSSSALSNCRRPMISLDAK